MFKNRFDLRRRGGASERGQVLIIVAGGMIAMIAMVGLVIDGGHAWGQQRITQNAADAVAKAGTVAILEFLGGDPTVQIGDVGCAVDDAEAASEPLDLDSVEFTDFQGEPIGLPVPICGTTGTIPDDVQGVKATVARDFDTFLMGVVGFSEMTARANATAVVGPIPGLGVALPVTFPQTLELCDGSERVYSVRDWDEPNVSHPDAPAASPGVWDPYEILPQTPDLTIAPVSGNLAIVPLCSTEPGSVGWLDYGCGNTHESITNPCEDLFINIPDWILTQPGNINCCEADLGLYHGDQVGTYEPDQDIIVKLPIHQVTCETDAGTTGSGTSRALNPCTTGPGEGNNLYYGVEFWVGFALDGAYVSGSDPECRNTPGAPTLSSPTGFVGCLKGWFMERIGHPDDISIGDLDPDHEGPIGITLIN